MNACDVIGYVEPDGCSMICAGCATAQERRDDGTGWHPIFGDAESDGPNHCERCEDLIPESWTADGWKRALDALLDVLHGRGGRLCILRQWYDDDATGDGCCESVGDVDGPGYFARIPFSHRPGGYIVEVTTYGSHGGTRYDDTAEFDAAWERLETSCAEFYDEPDDAADEHSPKPT